MPEIKENRHLILKFAFLLVIVGLLGIGLPFVLSYFLKTPYPLVVISEDSMRPVLAKNDLILVKGVISRKDIKTDDIIVYNSSSEGVVKGLAVQRVASAGDDELIIRGDLANTLKQEIDYSQVVGKVVGNGKVIKLPLVGALPRWFSLLD